MRTVLAVVLLLILVVTCVGPWRSTIEWTPDDATGSVDQLRHAAQTWNDACGERMFREVPEGGMLVHVYAGSIPDDSGAGGYSYVSQGPIYLWYDSVNGMIYQSAMHEFGHVAGLLHSAHGLMSASQEAYHSVPSQEDIEELNRRGWACEL